MTVKELIEQLQKIPADTFVVVQGYEEGFDDVSTAKEISLALNPDHKWYEGRYTENSSSHDKAVFVFSKDRMEGDSGE